MDRRPALDPLSRTKVLLVEYDHATCTLYAPALRMEGFVVCAASDPVAALRTLEVFAPVVVIVDLTPPIASGFEVLHELRASRPCLTLPVIAVSGNERGLTPARKNPEFYAALQKPFDPNDLIGVTRRAVHSVH